MLEHSYFTSPQLCFLHGHVLFCLHLKKDVLEIQHITF